MRFHDIKEGVGRIVKGVNTTSDVGTNAIKKQAAKFGNKVDKDGRPPTLSKKVKGSKTNVLFNLGMSENKYSPMEMAIMEGGHSLDDAKVLVDNTDESMLQYNMLEAKIGELAAASEIYVDMDGVLADFFGEWAKLMKVDHYSKIDGIDINVALQKIRDTDEFWLNLPMLPQAKQLLGLIKKVKGSYNICSSPLADDPNSEPHKREWIKRNLDFFPPNKVIITHNKPKYAKKEDGTPNILIDDFGKNIASWEAAGGVGFKYKDHKFERTAKAIQKYMKEPVVEKAVSKKQQQFFGIVRAMQKGDMPKGGEAGKVAKDMKKSDVKDYASTKHKGLPKKKKKTESYTRDQLPQITKKELKYIPHEIITVPVNSIIPVQKERLKENYTKQLKKIAVGKYNPIVVDIENKIINGHHRYDIVKMLQMEDISVVKIPCTLEYILEIKEYIATENILENFDNISDIDLSNALDTMAKNAVNGERLKDVFIMRHQHNMTFKQIGQEIGTGLDRARQVYQRALRKLRFLLKDYMSENFTEGYKLQLERDTDMMVLHIKDTATGKRTEVRGKSGYESGNYDADDKLHQLLDKVGKSVDISQLMNGEPVGINPKHPQGASAKDATDKAYNENFADGKKNEGAEITMWTNPEYQGADVDDKYYEKTPVKIVDISKLTPFEPADKMDPKDNQDNMMRFVDKIKAGKKLKPIVIVPHEGKWLIVDGHHRYFAHLKAGADKIRVVIADPKDLTWRDDVPESVKENFADGKKKGKSRPGRVKKAGASCNGSVTALRKRAKNASGEKAKMYHWCANMKSGRKKGK